MNASSIPVLSVKLKMPEPRKRYVKREYLFQKLDGMSNKKITVIKAGAGCGKTTLLSSYIRKQNMDCVKWITLDANMNQVFVFWKYVLWALKDFLPQDTNFDTMFDNNMQKDNMWQILYLLIDKLSQNQSVILVLDDFQMISEEFLIATIDFFIKNMPENVHLVMVSRQMPPIYMGILSIEDELLLIEEKDIRLTQEESRQFLIETLQISEDNQDIEEMIRQSNGWIGGLQLMAMSSHRTGLVFTGTDVSSRVAYEYISREIFEKLSDEQQDFLLQTSVLSYFNEKICDALTPQYEFRQMLPSIIEKNLFVISIDENQQEYRYHSIMKDFLEYKLKNTWSEEFRKKLHEHAANVCLSCGDEEECIQQLFYAKNYEMLMETLMQMPQNSITFTHMVQVPMEEIIKNINFAYQYFFCFYAAMEVEKCKKIYEYILENLSDDKSVEAFVHSNLFFDTTCYFNRVKTVPLEQIEALPLNEVTKAYLLIKEAYFLFLEDNKKEAIAFLEQAEKIYHRTGNEYIEIFVLAEKTQILEEYGQLSEALEEYQRMEKYLVGLPTMKASYYVGIAGVYIKQLRLKEAQEALDHALEFMVERCENVKSSYQYTLAELLYIQEEYDKSEMIIRKLSEGSFYNSMLSIARLLRYPVYRGSNKDLIKKYKQEFEGFQKKSQTLVSREAELLYAAILYEDGDMKNAEPIVDSIIFKARKMGNRVKLIESELLKIKMKIISKTVSVKNKQQEREVLNMFVETVNYGYENCIALPFWFEKNTVKFIIETYAVELSEKLSPMQFSFIRQIVYSKDGYCKDGIEKIGHKSQQYDLTEREMEVLHEIQKGCTNKQVADNLCITLATVKTHLINIYGKLGVNNRVAAINKIS